MLTRYSWLLLLALCAWAIDPGYTASALSSRTTLASSPNAFGSIALPVGPNRFAERWHQSLEGTSSQLQHLISPARAMSGTSRARFVNAAVNRQIEFRPDKKDRWSSPSETLRRSAGDCEDYAIAKMQALRSLGVSDRDLFLTIGHDQATREDHAVLLLRAGGQYWVLDNRSDRLIPAGQFTGFLPIISVRADGKSWLHGKRRRLQEPDIRDLLDGQRKRLREPDINELLAA